MRIISISSTKKKTLVLYFSTLFSVLCGVVTSVLNTHALDPSHYGDYRYVTNIINFVASLLLFGFFISGSRLLALSEDKLERRRINGVLVLILAIAIFISMLSMYVVYFFHHFCLHSPIDNLFLFIIPFCYAPLLQNYVNTVLQGENRITLLAISRLLPPILYILIAYWIYSVYGATTKLMLFLFNISLIMVLLVCILFTKPYFKEIRGVFNKLLVENKKYGLPVYVGSIFAVSFNYLSGIVLGLSNTDNTNVGYYTLALTIASPLTMLPVIVGTVFYRSFATQHNIPSKVLNTTLLLSVFSYIFFAIAIFPTVHFLYDESYYSVVWYTLFLGIGTTIYGLGDMFNRFLGSHGCGVQLRNGAIISGIILIIGNFTLVFIFDIWGAIATKILASIGYLLSMVYYYKKNLNSIHYENG